MIIYPDKFHQARPAGFDGIFDWDFLLPAFAGTKIEPMDIDGLVERYGRFLLFETKDTNKEIPIGQRIALERLIILGEGKIYLFILYGKLEHEINGIEEWHYDKGNCIKFKRMDCNATYVLKRVSDWFQWANKG